MKTTLQIVLAGMLMGAVVAKDGLFELVAEDAPHATPGKGEILVRMPVKERPGVKMGGISLLPGPDEGTYSIWADVDEYPGQEFTPVLVEGDRALIGSFKLGARTPSSMVFIFKCKSLKEGKLWLKFIQKHFKIDPSKVKIKAPGSPESAGEDPAAAAPSNAKARRVV